LGSRDPWLLVAVLWLQYQQTGVHNYGTVTCQLCNPMDGMRIAVHRYPVHDIHRAPI